MTEPSTRAPAASDALTPRRRALLEAALHVVAEEGLRGLTHRAVDRRAGLPEGSCSAYLRTRRALQHALTAYVAGSLGDDVRALAGELRHDPGDRGRALTATRSLFVRWLDERELLLVKLELSLLASRDPDLADVLLASRTDLVSVVAGIVDPMGSDEGRERAEALVAAFDGILVAALLKPPAERGAFLSRSVAQLLGALADGAPAADGPTDPA